MLQRIQTVYMLIALLAAATFGYAAVPVSDTWEWLYVDGMYTAAVILFFNIFLYKHRRLQIIFNNLVIILILVLMGLRAYEAFTSGESPLSKKDVVWLLPAVSIVFVKLANQAIWRDENLVKSADRIR